MAKITSRHIKAVVSLGLLVLLFGLVRTGDFVAMLKRVDPLYFALSFAIAAAQISVSCLKWMVLLNLQGGKATFGLLMKHYLIGYYFTNLMPSNVGGDVVRSYYAGRHIGSQTHAAISTFIERFSGSVYMLLLVLVCPLARPGLYPRLAIVIPSVAAIALLAGFAWITLIRNPLTQIVDSVIAVIRYLSARPALARSGAVTKALASAEAAAWKVQKKAETIHEKLSLTVETLRKDWKALLAVVALTVVFYALTWVNVYWSYRTFGADVPLVNILALLPTAMLAGSIPITLGSLGIVESSYVFYFRLVGVDPAATLAMGLFLRFKLIVVGIVGFLVYLTYRHDKYDHERLREQT